MHILDSNCKLWLEHVHEHTLSLKSQRSKQNASSTEFRWKVSIYDSFGIGDEGLKALYT